MSNALAIAAVTAVLKDLLQNGLIDHDVMTNLGDVRVSALPPDMVPAMDDPNLSQLNLFLYHVTPNTGWNQLGYPAYNSQGDRVSNQPLALDLHFLLTAFGGSQDFNAEILLGYGMHLLHEHPLLSRDAIQRALAPASPVNGSILPAAFQALSAADLADQVEQVKITPHYLSMEDMSRVWSTLQAHYRPSAAYQVSLVLIESDRPTKPALPVRDYNVYARPFRQPVIDQVISTSGAASPITIHDDLLILGHQLRGDDIRVRVGELELVPAQEDLDDRRIRLALDPALRAGIVGVQIVQYQLIGTPEVAHRGVESNIVPFVLRPAIRQRANGNYRITVENEVITDGVISADITVIFDPEVGPDQRVLLLLNEFDPPDNRPARAYSFQTPNRENDVDRITFAVSGIQTGRYLLRLQVDGAESRLDVDGTGKFDQPRVRLQ